MAQKRDWTKHNYKKLRSEFLSEQPVGGSRHQFYKNNNLWTLPGKYQGTHIHNLPLHYLSWLIDNFRDGEAKQQAVDELLRRYQTLDSNT